ncbi:MAG: peptidoglycan-binding protein [Acidobacteria bacterium]|nr:peptidoglycan-binding protein [Acidobacteriota bacterium]
MQERVAIRGLLLAAGLWPWLWAAATPPPDPPSSSPKPATKTPSASPKPITAPTAKSATPAKKAPTAQAAKKPPGKPAPKKRPARVPIGQNVPTRERYAEIQAALADAGYYDGPQDGRWGKPSVEALARFQEDHSLEPTGKIDALSLIRLGLGAKYEGNNPALNAVSAASP